MRKNLLRLSYLLIIVASLVAMSILVWNRHRAEETSKSIELVLDYDEFAVLAEQLDREPVEIFRQMRDAGFQSVAIKEDTLYDLSQKGKALDYALFRVFRRDVDWTRRIPQSAVQYLREQGSEWDVVVRVADAELLTRLRSSLDARYDADFFTFFDASGDLPATLILKGDASDAMMAESSPVSTANNAYKKTYRVVDVSMLETIGLGFDPQTIETVKSAGLEVHLRPSNHLRATDSDRLIRAYFEDVKRFGAQSDTVLFQGGSVLSYRSDTGQYSPLLYEIFHERNIRPAFVEAADQLGFVKNRGSKELAQELDYNIIRVYPVAEYIQMRYNYLGYYEKSKEIENTLYRAVTERNIRMVYFRPFKIDALRYFDDLDEYRVMVEGLRARLVPHGLVLGDAAPIAYNDVSVVWLFLMSLGVFVFGLMILKLVFRLRGWLEILLFVGGVIGTGGLLYVAPNTSLTLFAFAATIVFPMLSAVFLVEYMKDSLLSRRVDRTGGLILRAVIGFGVAVAIAFVGGLYVAGYLSRQDYLVEMSYFRGVKASLMLPMLLTLILYIIKLGFRRTTTEGDTNYYDDVKQFLQLDVKMYFLIIAGVLGGIVYLYLARSGNTSGIEVFDAELKLRIFLEEHLIARPRTKEIFLAFPALFAALFAAARGYKQFLLPLLLAGMVGITSILNTFCHSRTPVYLSIYRNLISFGISLVIGVLIVVILERIRILLVRHSSGADESREAN